MPFPARLSFDDAVRDGGAALRGALARHGYAHVTGVVGGAECAAWCDNLAFAESYGQNTVGMQYYGQCWVCNDCAYEREGANNDCPDGESGGAWQNKVRRGPDARAPRAPAAGAAACCVGPMRPMRARRVCPPPARQRAHAP